MELGDSEMRVGNIEEGDDGEMSGHYNKPVLRHGHRLPPVSSQMASTSFTLSPALRILVLFTSVKVC